MIGMSLGNVATRSLIRKVSLERLLLVANMVSAASATVLLAVTLFGYLTLAGLLALMFLFALGAGASSPAALSKALGVDAALVGSAAGLYGFMQMAVGALCTFAVGFGHDQALAAACVLTGAMILGQAALWGALRWERRRMPAA